MFIAGVIMASLLAVQPAMMQDRNCFELYGYDILLSNDLRPWLLEINASPALTGTDNEDQRLKSDLVDDVLNVLDFEVTTIKLFFIYYYIHYVYKLIITVFTFIYMYTLYICFNISILIYFFNDALD